MSPAPQRGWPIVPNLPAALALLLTCEHVAKVKTLTLLQKVTILLVLIILQYKIMRFMVFLMSLIFSHL